MAKPEYIQKNKAWLEAKSHEDGVHPLDKGIFYKVIKRGRTDGPSPNRSSVVVAHYTGKTINGKTFDNSRGGARADTRMDYCPPTNARRRQMGNIHPGRTGIR